MFSGAAGNAGNVDVSSEDWNDGEAEMLRMIVVPSGPTEYPYPGGTPAIGVDVTTTYMEGVVIYPPP